MKKISLSEHKKILVDILKFVDKVCRENDIKYSVLGGTAIGAVRHKGFIPWDDDIDIILDHSNYEKLKKILKSRVNTNYILLDNDNKDNYYPFLKVIDKRTVIQEFGYASIQDYGVFLDIFEYNNVPNNKILQHIYYSKIIFWKKLLAGLSWNGKRKDHKIILFFRFIISKLLGKKFLIKHYNELCHKYNHKKCDYIMANWPTYGLEKEIQKIDKIKEYKDIEFEKYQVMIFSNIDDILTTTFGDYMKLPPEEKRTSNHNMIAYWK